VILLTVSAIAWKLTSPVDDDENPAPSNCCALLFGSNPRVVVERMRLCGNNNANNNNRANSSYSG
jgi:hypothetical protein